MSNSEMKNKESFDYVFAVRCVKSKKFGNEPGEPHYLRVPSNVDDISPDHKVKPHKRGMMPSSWAKKVMENAKNDRNSGTGDILIYVHGYNTSTKEMLKRHRRIKEGIAKHGYPGAVVSFAWPSANSALNYLEDRWDAKKTALLLVSAGISKFAALQKNGCKLNLHVLAHSTGAYVVREAFDDADDCPAIANTNWSVSQLMLISADVSAASMSKSNPKSNSLYRHCVRLTNYSNPYDASLSLSNIKRLGVSPRVGRIGLPDDVADKAVEVDTGDHYKRIENRKGNSHTWYFFDDNIFMRDVAETIKGSIDRNRLPTRRGSNSRLELVTTPKVVEETLLREESSRKEVQNALAKRKLYTGQIDGIFGQLTREAIKKWQSASGYQPTEFIDEDQFDELT